MKKGQASQTAEIAAGTRAVHTLNEVPTIFDDPFAVHLTSSTWRKIAHSKVLVWLISYVLMRPQVPVAAQIIARSRFAEDLLEDAVTGGMGQYVLIGAGFDSFSLRQRDLHSALHVFELDHPDTQRVKRERMHALGANLPANLEFVEVNFEQQTVAEALAQTGYQCAKPAFFSWLGTTCYLSNEATLATLRSIAAYAAPGSEIVFDYMVPGEILSGSERRTLEKIQKFTARRGEPFIGQFHPDELKSTLDSIGMELIENLSGADQGERYFKNYRDDIFRPMHASYFAHARVKASSE